MMKRIGIGVISLMTLLFTGYVVFQYFIIGPQDSPFMQEKQKTVRGFSYYPWIYFLYIHIVFGLIPLLLGPLQFMEKFRKKKPGLHKRIGKIYVFSILLSSMVGLYLSFYGSGGLVSVIGFYSLDLVWFLTTFIGFLKITKKQVQQHKEWMIRSYAVTLTFVSFRIWASIPMAISGERGALYGLTIIFSWALNLLLAEWVISSAKKRNLHFEPYRRSIQ